MDRSGEVLSAAAPMIRELERLDDVAGELSARARAAGVLLIWRAQTQSMRRVVVRDGRGETASVSSVAGNGLQVVTAEGYSALGSRDDLRGDAALALFDRTLASATAGSRLGLARIVPEGLEPTRARSVPDRPWHPDDFDLDSARRRLIELEAELDAAVPGTSLMMSYKAELEVWRIVRSDGTDVLFSIPRCNLGVRATGAGNGARHAVSATVFATRPEDLWDGPVHELFRRRARKAAELARVLPDAPTHPAGSYPLVIDYALAKGLAHEAFGHASEADGFRSSVLAKDGRFKSGEHVGADHVSIIDEPIADDHAWQPFSANGLPRRRATLVDHGRLADGLSDPWSAGPGGVRLTGAGRAESFRHAPQPRMTNIRIEVDDPLPAPGDFEDYGPDEVRGLLASAGVFRRHPEVVFLSGYSGGQVNAATGDFVFNCKAIYRLSERAASFHKPAIFSGSMFGALKAVREAFGPLRLDATGYCGKWGQSVPSSGGSHYFLVLDDDPTVRLGGR